MLYTHLHSPFTLYTPRSRCQYFACPGTNTLELVSPLPVSRPLKPPVKTKHDTTQTQATPAQTPTSSPDPQQPRFHPKRGPQITKEESKRARQPELFQDKTVPTPQ
ncbi:hypothetical protein CHARACLAT_033279 [Characodon lateralis]|uniref:Uncharacterized protein n=1 Tax=Characodon lateralis TaxID=208331 RepID=A0ABU7EYW7_9TELE|nr:hypothetical protein [Characodon lateralis]